MKNKKKRHWYCVNLIDNQIFRLTTVIYLYKKIYNKWANFTMGRVN